MEIGVETVALFPSINKDVIGDVGEGLQLCEHHAAEQRYGCGGE